MVSESSKANSNIIDRTWVIDNNKSYSVTNADIYPMANNKFIILSGNTITKLNMDGTIYWQKEYLNELNQPPIQIGIIEPTNDGGYIAVGSIESRSDRKMIVLKLDDMGLISWQKIYDVPSVGDDGDFAHSIEQIQDGGFFIVGQTAENYIQWLLKINNDGTIVWEKVFEGTYLAVGKPTMDGGFVMFGAIQAISSTGAGNVDLIVLKLQANGSTEWQKAYATDDYDRNVEIIELAEGGFYVGAYAVYSAGSSEPHKGPYLLKLSASGDVVWARGYASLYASNLYVATDMNFTSDGGVIMTGYYYPSSKSHLWVIKLNSNGFPEWSKVHKGDSYSAAYGVHEVGDKHYLVTGRIGGSRAIISLDRNGYSTSCYTLDNLGVEATNMSIVAEINSWADLGDVTSTVTTSFLLAQDSNIEVEWDCWFFNPNSWTYLPCIQNK